MVKGWDEPTSTALNENMLGVVLAMMMFMATAVAGMAQGSITNTSMNHLILYRVFSIT